MYSAVNEALNQVFLDGRFESRPLYLVLDKRARDELTEILTGKFDFEGLDIEDACCRVVGGHLAPAGDPYDNAVFAALSWRANGRKTRPPFTAILFTLARAAELMVSDGQFSSSNYYQRLASITGRRGSHFSGHGSSSEKLWGSFNNWLADTDFQFGRPTARAVNAYRYVGIAMSQAIVREEDLQRFHEMFEKYGFRETDAITEEEIAQYIGNWIHSSRPTGRLKEAWRNIELRPRVCEAAVAELRDWNKAGSGTQVGQSRVAKRLSFAASFKHDHFAGTRSILPWLGREAEIQTIELSQQCGAPLTLGNSTYGNFATVEPRGALDWVTVLTHGAEFVTPEDESFAWTGRPVIPLSRSERGNYWTEVSRVTLGVEHVVLARSEKRVLNQVEQGLELVATPGYSLSTAKELKGLPAGWVAYERVQITSPMDEPSDLQLALSPLGETSGLQVIGGLKIGQSIWHERKPPRVALDARGKPVSIRAWAGTSVEGEEICRNDNAEGRAELDLSHCLAKDGNVYVQGYVDGQLASAATLLLRSADRPRPLDRQLRGFTGYSSPWKSAPIDQDTELVRGMDIPVTRMHEHELSFETFRTLGKISGEEENVTIPSAQTTRWTTAAISLTGLQPEDVMKLPCSVRGLHVFRYETLPPDFPKYLPVNKECKDCGTHVLERRPRMKTMPRPGMRMQTKAVPVTTIAGSFSERLSMDLWMDAASFWGRGSLAAFEALVSAEGLDPWRASQVLRDLSWLGHVDLDYGSGLKPRSWSIAPPVLSYVTPEKSFFSGFRNAALLNGLQERLVSIGATISMIIPFNQPGLVYVEGATPVQASEAIAGLRDYHGRPVKVVENPAIGLANFALERGDIRTGFTPMTLSDGDDVERFDLARSRWRRTDSTKEPGAYRFVHAGTQYAFRSSSGQAYVTSHEFAKLGAARLSGVRLHAYDEEDQVFSSVLGCEPPALLSRVLVACSGRLPTIKNGVSVFGSVPSAVAARVLAVLYNGDIPS